MAASPNIVSTGSPMIITKDEATAAQRTWCFFLTNSADGTAATGKTLATTDFKISKAGGAFGNAVGTITEMSLGWYKIVFDAGDVDTLGTLACELSGEAGVDTLHVSHQIVAADLNSNLPLGISFGSPMMFTQSEATAAQATWLFYLANSADGSAATGKTIATTDFKISKNGAAYGNATGTVTEASLGWYKMVFAAADLDTIGALSCELSGESGVCPLRVVHQITAFDHNTALTTATIAAALGQDVNTVLDGGSGVALPTYDAHGMLTAGRIRVFPSNTLALAATAGATTGTDSETAGYTISASGTNGRVEFFRKTII